MSVKNWNFQYKEKKDNSRIEMTIRAGLVLYASYLFWLAFMCINERWSWYLGSKEITMSVVLIMVIGLAYEIVIPHLGKWEDLAKKVFPFICIAGIVLYVVRHWTDMINGFCYCMNPYLVQINNYYGLELSMFDPTTMGIPIRDAFASARCVNVLLLLFVWVIVVAFAYKRKKLLLLTFFPAVGIIMSLVAGLSPDENAVWRIFIGALLLLVAQMKGISARVILGACIIAGIIISNWLWEDEVKELATKKDELIAWQEGLRTTFSANGRKVGITNITNEETIDNEEPLFTGKVVIQVFSDSLPSQVLFLKGYYGTDYVNGRWVRDEDSFRIACKEEGYETAYASQAVSQMAANVMKNPYEIYSELPAGNQIESYRIKYTDSIGDIAFVPYSTVGLTGEDSAKAFADSLIKKDSETDEIIVNACISGDYMDGVLYQSPELRDVPEMDFRNWYSEYVMKHYLDVPEDMHVIKAAAKDAAGDWEYPEKGYFNMVTHADVELSPEIEARAIENLNRHLLAMKVYVYLYENMSYSLWLDDISKGTDPLEYALTESHEGYCMHFASIATLMLRELGVPARYASGYVVYPSDFDWDMENGYHYASVIDRRAHAWVEIYYEDVGWIPMEMTPAYDTEVVPPTEMDAERLDTISENNRPKRRPVKVEEEVGDATDEVVPEQENEPEEVPAIKDETNPTKNTVLEKLGKIIVVVIGSLALCALITIGIIKRKKAYEKLLASSFDNEDYKKLVHYLNKRIYYRLRVKLIGKRKEALHFSRVTDDEYVSLLEEMFPSVEKIEWWNYMEILKKVRFSAEEITKEDALACYQCYLGVKNER